MYIAGMKIFCETVEFPDNYFLMGKSLNHKIIDKKGVDPPAPETPSCLIFFLRFSWNVILLSAIRFGYHYIF